MTDEPARSSGARLTTREEKNFPFHISVRESENNVEHLRSRGALSGIFLSRQSSFGRSRVVGLPLRKMFSKRFPSGGHEYALPNLDLYQ